MSVMHLRLPLFVVVALGVGWLGACSPGPSQTEGLHDSRDSSGGESDTVSVEQAPQVDRDAADEVFDDSLVYAIELTMSDQAWLDVAQDPWAENWHTAEFRWEGEVVADVGVRAFGYSSHVAGKPPLKIDFNRIVSGQRWRGLETLKLRNGYYDASFMHDALAPWMLRRAGVPASRTGWARVTVNGEWVGLYTVMEAIDDRFLTESRKGVDPVG